VAQKLTCLADCDHVIYGDDAAALGRRMRDHLRAVHGVPADPSELAGLAIPVAGIRRCAAD
jgi:hypothetical protein